MSENSNIEWTDHTFNPWIGCAKVSPGCANCYAEAQDKFRSWTPEGWGAGKPRRLVSDNMWKQPLKWNRDVFIKCDRCGVSFPVESHHHVNFIRKGCMCGGMLVPQRPRVFCASLADWLDDDGVPIEWLLRLLCLIRQTPNLDWLLLTKRPVNFEDRISRAADAAGYPSLAYDWRYGRDHGRIPFLPDNVWIGTTVEDQERADERIPQLLSIPSRVRFLSCEPLLGRVDITPWLATDPVINWVICGGESGPKARPMHPDWARSLRDQCAAAGVAFFFKQWGEWVEANLGNIDAAKESHFLARDGSDETERPINEYSDGTEHMVRVGKKRAGRLLDGIEHSAFPVESGVRA